MKIICFLILLVIIKTDLPIHCYINEISGKWTVQMSKSYKTGFFYYIIGRGELSCNHNIPTNENTASENFELKKSDVEHTFDIILKNDNSCEISEDGEKILKTKDCRFTMIYDEGFDIFLGDYNFFHFSKYIKKDDGFSSICSETLVGWWSEIENKNIKNRGCHTMKKKESLPPKDEENARKEAVL